jgi:hypothetical protein
MTPPFSDSQRAISKERGGNGHEHKGRMAQRKERGNRKKKREAERPRTLTEDLRLKLKS